MAALLVLVAGCATAKTAPTRALYPGDAQAAPSIEALPQPDVPVRSMTKRMRFAWLLAEESFELPDPPPPPKGASMSDLEQWSDTKLEPWLAKKSRLVEAARAELDTAADQDHRQLIIAGALVGLMYEDVARVLLDVPPPNELRSEPKIRSIYHDVVDFQASPYLRLARRAYRACSANAVWPHGMRAWSRFCSDRLDRLPGKAPLRSGETQVTVTVQ